MLNLRPGGQTPAPGPVASFSSGQAPAEGAASRSAQAGTAPVAAVPDTLPGSLEGTRPPGDWNRVDDAGHLLPTPDLRGLFEYYLAALGEESLDQLVARIRQALQALPEPARSEARQLLGDYLDYKLAVGELEARTGAGADMATAENALASIRDLRRKYLGEVAADAFFAREEAVDRYQAARREILARDDLTDAQRIARLQAAEAALPESLRRAREESRKFIDYETQLRALQADPDANQAAINRLRETTFGAEVAERLARVEAAQADWDRRWSDYRADLARLDAAGLAGPEQKDAVQRLRDRYFSDQEQIRVQALDSIQ
ncbi:lipase secretion chaperone [Marinobacter halodurans]|uniref:lipase secretion chaperone n=1 Tax=Marinobacter halodurans TaxID=2528979 RepID=UPI0013F16B4D|nr:lipase secretion chaperone [Marinobacter halodurans]